MKRSADSLEDDFAKPAKQLQQQKQKPRAARQDIGALQPEDAPAFWAAKFLWWNPTATVLEQRDNDVPATAFVKGILHDSQNIDKFVSFVEELAPKNTLTGKQLPVIVLSSSALRCLDVMKALKDSFRVAKLFAKHKKIGEQKAFLAKERADIGVGTPGRVLALFEDGAIQLSDIQLVVIDAHMDAKTRTIFDMGEIARDLIKLVKGKLLDALKNGQIKIAFY